ncbi:MAG: molybdate ABC transporter permease subunit [Armatimonas sp.]
MNDLAPLWLSARVTGAALVLVVIPGLAAALLMTFRRFPGKALFETLLTLPLVLPPTVVGYGLLLTLGRGTTFGRWLNESAHVQFLFTETGITIAAAVMGLPLFIRPVSAAFSAIEPDLLEAARIDGARRSALLFRILLPLSTRGLLAGTLLAGARALGEFGATLMVGGALPGRTETLPIVLYNAVQAGQDHQALVAALWLTGTALVLVWLVNRMGRV